MGVCASCVSVGWLVLLCRPSPEKFSKSSRRNTACYIGLSYTVLKGLCAVRCVQDVQLAFGGQGENTFGRFCKTETRLCRGAASAVIIIIIIIIELN